jgi:8-oxo-dGTP pyrophosphatase MutT (NUDIX family)
VNERGSRTGRIIPEHRLPPGFAQTLDSPTEHPAPARPAATVVLLRDGAGGPETFLLRRNRSAGFVPGAFVFPGGRVDPADADAALAQAAIDLPAEPEPAYWMAALRETFEETGVLLARPRGEPPPADVLLQLRDDLLEDRVTLGDLLDAVAATADFTRMACIAHWITPVAEPRRYDTRFFLAAVPGDVDASPDPREMSEALWIPPGAALDRFRDGRLPMVFPTVHTLELLAPFRTTADALESLRGRTVQPILPRLVRRPEGIGIVIDDEEN